MLKKLYIELSSKCNLNCKMCFRNNWFDEENGLMSESNIKRLKYEIIHGEFEGVFFGGMGEPLIHPALFELINAAHNSGKYTELITNATLLDADTSEKIITNGLDRLWISMDGFSEESYQKIRRGSLFKKIINNIFSFNKVRENTELGITFVIMKENEYELENINSFADLVGADIINISHVIPESPIEEKETIYSKGYPIGKMQRFSFEIQQKRYDYCPFIEDENCFVRWDGEVTPCMQLLHNSYSYLYTIKRKSYFKSYGNIGISSLSDIWNSVEYTEFRNRVKAFDFPGCTVCLGCDYRLENVTDCMYNNSPTCGACLWAQGLIRCP